MVFCDHGVSPSAGGPGNAGDLLFMPEKSSRVFKRFMSSSSTYQKTVKSMLKGKRKH
jgi:hypothetical protein